MAAPRLPVNYAGSYNIRRHLEEDFEKLLINFTQQNSLRYGDFIGVWKALHFYYLFAGRQNAKEARELAHECLIVGVARFLKESDIRYKVGALYFAYAIYFLQPVIPRERLRLTPEAVDTLTQLREMCRQDFHWDVVYIIHKMKTAGAIRVVATFEKVHPTHSFLMKPEQTTNAVSSSLFTALFDTDAVAELARLQSEYEAAKQNLGSSLPPYCDVAAANMPSVVAKHLATFTKHVQSGRRRRHSSASSISDDATDQSSDGGHSEEERSLRISHMKKLKDRAMGAQVEYFRGGAEASTSKKSLKKEKKGESSMSENSDSDEGIPRLNSKIITTKTTGTKKTLYSKRVAEEMRRLPRSGVINPDICHKHLDFIWWRKTTYTPFRPALVINRLDCPKALALGLPVQLLSDTHTYESTKTLVWLLGEVKTGDRLFFSTATNKGMHSYAWSILDFGAGDAAILEVVAQRHKFHVPGIVDSYELAQNLHGKLIELEGAATMSEAV